MARAGHVFFSEIWSERWAVRLGSTQTTTNTKILGTYPIWQCLRWTFFFLNCKDGLMDDLHWFTYGCWMCFCSISFILSHDIVFSVFFSILKMGDWCFYVYFLVGFGVCLLFRQSFRRQSLMHTENVFFSSNSVLLGVLNAFLRCTPWCWMVCPPSRGSCLPLSSIVPLLVSLCWRLGLKTRAFLDALPIGTACFCAFLPRTSLFRGVGVGVGWDGVGWG